MSRKCEVCGKGQVSGNAVSHSNRHTRRKWNANIQTVRIVEENGTLPMDDPKYTANEAKIKELYEKARPNYEKAKELKPDNRQLWGQYLLNIYWKLNKAEYDALEKELTR